MSTVEQHARRFKGLVQLAVHLMREPDPEGAVLVAQVAADYAWGHHPGHYTSSELEAILVGCSRSDVRLQVAARAVAPAPSIRRVLHVLSIAYATGGHTRFAARWMTLDPSRTHAVALTRQGSVPIPRDIEQAASARGGSVARLDQVGPSVLDRAAALHELAASFDAVVLHLHPNDAMPSLAFAGRTGGPKVLFLNHADHVFWLGARCADLYVNFRESGRRLALRRRGLEAEATAMLPVPIVQSDRVPAREAARREIGVGDDTVLILTVGSPYKFEPVGGAGFIETVEPIIARHPSASLLAAGPPDAGRWAVARSNTGGRIRALGQRSDLPMLFRAADVYVDSFPCGSVTAMLEAGAHGLALASFCPLRDDAEILRSDSPGLSAMVGADRTEAFEELLAKLIQDQGLRSALGSEARASVLAHHTGDGWTAVLEEIYRRPATAKPAGEVTAAPGEVDRLTAQLQAAMVRGPWLSRRVALSTRAPLFWLFMHVAGVPTPIERRRVLRLVPRILRALAATG